MSNFYKDVLMPHKAFRSIVTQKDLALLEPGTHTAVVSIVAEARRMGFDLRVGETFRSQARQTYVYNQKASKLKKVGCHGYGLAADLQLFRNGKYIGDGDQYDFLMPLCRKFGMVSGIDWGDGKKGSFIDAGHVQRIMVSKQEAVFSGKWYPPVVYNPYTDH